MGRPSKWSPEFREEAVRLYRESGESITAGRAPARDVAGFRLASTDFSAGETVFGTSRDYQRCARSSGAVRSAKPYNTGGLSIWAQGERSLPRV
jgi:hypothetical protein